MAIDGFLVFLVLAFVAFFLALWCFILWLASRASGWRRLAERFGTPVEFSGDVASFVSARIGIANYSGVLILGASDQGLYLVPIRIYRLFHRPLLIPWTEIAATARDSAFMPRVQLTFPNVPHKRIFLYGRSAKLCLPYLHREGRDDRAIDEWAAP